MKARNELPDDRFLTDTINELNKNRKVYVYKDYILEEKKKKYSDLIITENKFYWEVKRGGK